MLIIQKIVLALSFGYLSRDIWYKAAIMIHKIDIKNILNCKNTNYIIYKDDIYYCL